MTNEARTVAKRFQVSAQAGSSVAACRKPWQKFHHFQAVSLKHNLRPGYKKKGGEWREFITRTSP